MRLIISLIKSAVTLFLLIGCCFTYSIYIEPKLITTETVNIKNYDLPLENQKSIKIIHFSDTHLGFHFDLKQLEKTVTLINEKQPDIVVFTGDLIDHASSYDQIDEVGSILAKIEAQYGKYAVYGNHDYGGGAERHYRSIMTEGGFTLLINEVATIALDNQQQIAIGGLDEVMLGNPDPQKVMDAFPPNAYQVLLLHEPDVVDRFSDQTPHLTLAGHSHGGQIQLPFYGPLITTAYAEKYIEGQYFLDTQQNHSIFVNTGLGTTKLPMRFFNPPVITILNVTNP